MQKTRDETICKQHTAEKKTTSHIFSDKTKINNYRTFFSISQ